MTIHDSRDCRVCNKRTIANGDYKNCDYCTAEFNVQECQGKLAIINFQISELIKKRDALMENIADELEIIKFYDEE